MAKNDKDTSNTNDGTSLQENPAAPAPEYSRNTNTDNSNNDDGKTEQERHADAMADVAHVNEPGEFYDTPELPASEMSVEDAERINSNVNAPGEYPPSEVQNATERTGQQTGQTQTTAPHDMGRTEANESNKN